MSTVDPLRLAHAGLDVDRPNLLPALLGERSQIVNGHSDVVSDFLIAELNSSSLKTKVPDGAAEADALLELEPDSVLDFFDLVDDLLTLAHGDGESVDLDQHVSEELGDLLDDHIGAQKDVVLLGPLVDFGTLLIEGLQTFDIDEVDASLLGLVVVNGVTHDADLELVVDQVGEPHEAAELLVLFEIVVPEHNLQLHRLHELSLLAVLGVHHFGDGLLQVFGGDLAHGQ